MAGISTGISIVPYCGLPPLPDALWSRWNLDPILIACLTAAAFAYALGARRLDRSGRALTAGEQAAFYAGWAVAAAALISPLCALSVSLFAARVGQHMILALIAAPLIAASRPMAVVRAVFGKVPERSRPRHRALFGPLPATAAFAALLWFWHAPAPYAATFASTFVYWAMHVTLFGAALWLWVGLIDPAPARAVPAIGAGVASSVQMGFLGALITLAPRPLYAPHALSTGAWGLSALQDQQLGGAIMWIPGCVIFLAVAMLVLWRAANATHASGRLGVGVR